MLEGWQCKQQKLMHTQNKDTMDVMHKNIGTLLRYATVYSVACAYPNMIFGVYRSSSDNKTFHCFFMAFFSCPVHRSFLIESTKIKMK